MNYDLLVLYNPRYQSDLIDAHLAVLRQKGKVAFGKVRVKNNDMPHPNKKELEELYASVNEKDFLHLFITDYANLYVAKVEQITHEPCFELAPSYYADKGLDVESWFIITDMRELFRDDFKGVRDYFLASITAPLRDNHTYAVYGNNYVYPLIIKQKEKQSYFEDDALHYKKIYKTQKYFEIKALLENYCLGRDINLLMSDSLDAIISAQIEFDDNKYNPLNDFSSVIMKYSKTAERELYAFFKALFAYLCYNNPGLKEDIRYEVQGLKYRFIDIFTHKPNLGTYAYLMKKDELKATFERIVPTDMQARINNDIMGFMEKLKDIRNENMHGKSATFEEASELRNNMLGIGKTGFLSTCLELKFELIAMYKESC